MTMAAEATDATIGTIIFFLCGFLHESEGQSLGFPSTLQEKKVVQDMIKCTKGLWITTEKSLHVYAESFLVFVLSMWRFSYNSCSPSR